MENDITNRLYAQANILAETRDSGSLNLHAIAELIEEAAQEIESLRSQVRHPDVDF